MPIKSSFKHNVFYFLIEKESLINIVRRHNLIKGNVEAIGFGVDYDENALFVYYDDKSFVPITIKDWPFIKTLVNANDCRWFENNGDIYFKVETDADYVELEDIPASKE